MFRNRKVSACYSQVHATNNNDDLNNVIIVKTHNISTTKKTDELNSGQKLY